MAIAPTYPGVYIEEIPSGVRTITGVSTSVTAFVGSAKRGSINKAVHILSYADYERVLGGLRADSEMSYAVRQFFINGGTDAWIVRLAKDAFGASRTLRNSSADVLKISALDEGETGNDIEVRVAYPTSNPASAFDLTFNYTAKDNPADSIIEKFLGLSMDSDDPRYVKTVVNGDSKLVLVERMVTQATLDGLSAGTSISADLVDETDTLLDVATLVDAAHSQLRVSVNGLAPVSVTITAADVIGGTPADRLASLCTAIRDQVKAAGAEDPLNNFSCARQPNTGNARRIKMTSGFGGEHSRVRVLPGERNDLAGRLKLGSANGGVETDGVAAVRPLEGPDHGTLTSDTFGGTDLDTLPDATHTSFKITLDGQSPDDISIGDTLASGANLAAKLGDVAERIQAAVRAKKPAVPAYRDFTCAVESASKLLFASGTRGAGSSVVVSAAATNSIAAELHVLSGITTNQPTKNMMLEGGSESPYKPSEAYPLFIADRSQRKGIYALEEVDLFNLLCLPGVTDPGILMDADSYCKERRAFLIADAPNDVVKPDDMVDAVSGTALPKTEYGAVYYPWIKVADPLKGGRLRTSAPCGTVAGLYARTDGTRGVWKAPAGTDATLTGVQEVEYTLTDRENGTLNPLGVNCIRIFPIYGVLAWGARTLRGADQMTSEYKYVSVRRLALYIEESLYRGTKWVVFAGNDERLWSQIRLNVGAFMHRLFRQGAFQGESPRKAYFVKCDKETTTQTDINLGIVNIVVGFAPLKPAEFVIIKIQQIAGQIEA